MRLPDLYVLRLPRIDSFFATPSPPEPPVQDWLNNRAPRLPFILFGSRCSLFTPDSSFSLLRFLVSLFAPTLSVALAQAVSAQVGWSEHLLYSSGAVGRAVWREVGLFCCRWVRLGGKLVLHKVELCVSSWREVGPFIKVEICLKNFDVASSLVGDFSLIIHWKRSWSLSCYNFWLLISEEKLVSFLLFGKFCSLFVCG